MAPASSDDGSEAPGGPMLESTASMNPALEKLIELQTIDAELKKIEGALADAPRQKAALDAGLNEERLRLDGVKESIGGSQKNRRQQESELQDLESKRSKYKGQLMEVKTNKEYTAMLHEIENVEREIKAREDQILVEMERAETLQGELKHEEALYRKAEETHRTESRALEERQKRLEAEAALKRTARQDVSGALPSEPFELYERVARFRGSGLAEARDEMCQECHVKLRLQMFVEIKHNEEIVQCPSCSRILYFEPPVPVALHQP
jgi:predicted  nucleic acid-binding Zn-ribbon protein